MELIGAYQNQTNVQKGLAHLAKVQATAPRLSEAPPPPPDPPKPRPPRRTAEDIEALLAAFRAGSTVTELSKEFGIHRNTIWTTLKRHGIAPHHRGLTKAQLTQATKLYAQGWSIMKIAQALSVPDSTLGEALRRSGSAMRDNRGRPK